MSDNKRHLTAKRDSIKQNLCEMCRMGFFKYYYMRNVVCGASWMWCPQHTYNLMRAYTEWINSFTWTHQMYYSNAYWLMERGQPKLLHMYKSSPQHTSFTILTKIQRALLDWNKLFCMEMIHPQLYV